MSFYNIALCLHESGRCVRVVGVLASEPLSLAHNFVCEAACLPALQVATGHQVLHQSLGA